jgi:G3E family GTPase
LVARLAALNPAATLVQASFGVVDPVRLFDMGADVASGRPPSVPAWLGLDPPPEHDHDHAHGHAEDISCFAILRETPIRAVTLTLLLEALAEHCGADLLRLKGLVNITESPVRPAVIHGVQHVFHPPTWLDRWPSDDRRTRLVLVTRGIPRAWVEALLAAIEAEVEEVSSRVH